jgi:hypothetical protein
MNYGDVTNNLTKSNDYFNKLLYRDILSLKPIVNLKKENNEMLKYYYKQKGKKKIYKLIQNMYFRKIMYNFKINFYLRDILW